MRWLSMAGSMVLLNLFPGCVLGAQNPEGGTQQMTVPLPDVQTLLLAVERNQKHLEALQRDYTYHVHLEQQELDKAGGVKKTETEDAESLTISGVRVDKVVARNGKPLTPEEQQKESARIDKEVAKAKDRQAKLAASGSLTDQRGNEVMPLSRILELGSFTDPRRVTLNGRPTLLIQYAGNPQAKTHNAFETIMRDVVGSLAVDEADRVLIRGEGHFVSDFKLGGGLLADVHKGASFAFQTTRIGEGIWLPATVDGQGSARVLLFAHFNGRMHLVTSDYRRFHASATIVGSHGAIGSDGTPLPDQVTPPATAEPKPQPEEAPKP